MLRFPGTEEAQCQGRCSCLWSILQSQQAHRWRHHCCGLFPAIFSLYWHQT